MLCVKIWEKTSPVWPFLERWETSTSSSYLNVGNIAISQVQCIELFWILQFICEPKQLHVVKKALQELSFKPSEARIEYIPHTFVTLDSSQTDLASQMIEHIKTCEDVVQIYHNIQFS